MPMPHSGSAATAAVAFDNVSLAFDDHVVLRGVSFAVPQGAMTMLLGASGAGKSVILKLILGLLRPDSGTVLVHGRRVDAMEEPDLLKLRAEIGMVFQENALFDSLTVAENIGFRLYEDGELSDGQIRARIEEVLRFIGLTEVIDRMPASLSGGQRRRVAIARAIAPKPGLLLYDDPIRGLDPLIAISVDDEIIKLRDLEHVTSIVVTHQMRDAYYIAEHEAVRGDTGVTIAKASRDKAERVGFMMLRDGRIHFRGSGAELLASQDPYLKQFMLMTLPPWGAEQRILTG